MILKLELHIQPTLNQVWEQNNELFRYIVFRKQLEEVVHWNKGVNQDRKTTNDTENRRSGMKEAKEISRCDSGKSQHDSCAPKVRQKAQEVSAFPGWNW